MQAQRKQTHLWQRRLLTGLAWFVAVAYLFFAPFKFSPVGVLGYPSYYVKFVQWGYPAWVSPVVGGVEILAAVMLLLPRRRFLGAGMLVLLMTGAVTTHIIDHDMLADNFSAPVMLVLDSIVALANWPADWREPLALGRRGEARVPGMSQRS
ncbi:MAG TPA: DoxX family protein [Ktedonobacterales bacterium]|nr:DoxX family protein [Ktedonobacterales bacterium]